MSRRGSMSEDPQFRTVYMPDGYPSTTTSPIRYVPVLRGTHVIGYVWAAVTDDALAYEARPDAGPDGFNTGVKWVRRFRWAKAHRVPPLQVLRQWAGQPEDPETGHVPLHAEREAPNLETLQQLARSPDSGPPGA